MMDVYDLYRQLLGAVNSHQAGFLPPDTFVGWLHQISMNLFAEKFSNYGKNQKLDDDLAKPFLKTVNIQLVPQPGKTYDLAPYPPDYVYHAASRVIRRKDADTGEACLCKATPILGKAGKVYAYEDPDYKELRAASAGSELCEVGVEKVDNQRWQAVCEDSFKNPTYKSPKITQFDDGFKVAPKGIGILVMDYFIQPKTPVLIFTTGASDEIIYNQPASTQLQWSPTLMNEFISRLKQNYGTFTRDPMVFQAGALENKKS